MHSDGLVVVWLAVQRIIATVYARVHGATDVRAAS